MMDWWRKSLGSVAPKSYRASVVWIALFAIAAMLNRGLTHAWDVNYAFVNLARWTLSPNARRSARFENARMIHDRLERALVSKGVNPQSLRFEVYRSYFSNYLAASLAEENLFVADESLHEGVTQETAGRVDEAITAFEQAITNNPRLVAAYPWLYASYLASDRTLESNRLYSQLRVLAPSKGIGKSDRHGRWAPVPFIELATGVRFIGYDLLTSDLAYSREIPITLYWEVDVCETGQSIRSWEADGWSWVSAGSRLYQMGTTENLVPNPGFEEWGLLNHEDDIAGWQPLQLSGWPQPRAEIVLNENTGWPTNELKLTSVGPPSAFRPRPQPLTVGNSWHLVAGSISAEPGVNGCVALRYVTGQSWDRLFCTSGLNTKSSMRASVLIEPGSATKYLILVNYSSGGSAWYDNVLLTSIEPPDLETVASHCSRLTN